MRCKMFEAIGADICYAENLQSMEEYKYLRNCLDPGKSNYTRIQRTKCVPHKSGQSNGD